METEETRSTDTKQVKRFLTYEEFLAAFYPASTARDVVLKEQQANSGDFGTNLAIESLNRHSQILKFGDT